MKNVKKIFILFLFQFFFVKSEKLFEIGSIPFIESVIASNAFFDPNATSPSDVEEALVCANLKVLDLEDNDGNFESLYRIYAHNVNAEDEKIEINANNIKAAKFIIRFNGVNKKEITCNPGYIDAVVSCLNFYKPENITFQMVLNLRDMMCELYDE